jgi:ribonuclease T1
VIRVGLGSLLSSATLRLALALCLIPVSSACLPQGQSDSIPGIAVAELPAEARETIALIRKGGPFPHRRDAVVFGNFEKRLPAKARGHYREYTVRTPGAKDRGARRIVAGRGGELYYTDDHYNSFRRIKEP